MYSKSFPKVLEMLEMCFQMHEIGTHVQNLNRELPTIQIRKKGHKLLCSGGKKRKQKREEKREERRKERREEK